MPRQGSVLTGRSRGRLSELLKAYEHKQRRGHSEAEIVLVTPRVLAARQHRNLSAGRIAKGL